MNYNNIPQNNQQQQQYQQQNNFHGNPYQPIKIETGNIHHQQQQQQQSIHQGYYRQPVEMEIDYQQQPRRAISYGGPPPSFINQHCSPQIHGPPQSMQMDHSMNNQGNYIDSRNQMLSQQSQGHQQIPQQHQYNMYNNNYPQQQQQGLPLHVSEQHSPMIRKMSSHNGGLQQSMQQQQQPIQHQQELIHDNNNTHFMHQNINYNNNNSNNFQHSIQQQHQNHEPHRTLSTAGIINDGHKREQSLSRRKISLAPNIRMNSTYGTEFEPNTPIKRSQSQSMECARRKSSLRQFSSQLRIPKITGIENPMLSLIKYTPPPMLSPIRNGIGLFCKVSRKPSEYRKKSTLFDMTTDVIMEEDIPTSSINDNKDDITKMDDIELNTNEQENNLFAITQTSEESTSLQNQKQQQQQSSKNDTIIKPTLPIRPPIDNRANRPKRKMGVFLCGEEDNSTGFAAELEALRKESAESSMSSNTLETLANGRANSRKCSIYASTSSDDVIRKMSTVSMDETAKNRKISTLSETYYDYIPCESDATPHINLGKAFQARVKKWSDREIMPHEREAIPDRDEIVFDCNVVDHLDDKTVAAYEALACSAAFPKTGRNKELALHILMENKGNIQAAVMDLLRCDTLDWEQYPIIYNYLYNDIDNWTADEVSAFQDAIYKSEKDFHQVATELGNRTVKECVGFYYVWKKACPDDYRKLRNLRRKRQLLEQQLEYSTISNKQDEKRIEETTDDEIQSESESSIGTPAYNHSPEEKPAKIPRITTPSLEKKHSATVRFSDSEQSVKTEQQMSNNSMSSIQSNLYPWLHAENGVFPSPSPTNQTNNNYSQPPSVGGTSDIFSNNSFNTDILNQKIANIHRVTAAKKGAQPSADGYFHCRLCDKRFEKVKSLNAHMKSHAMKARAEAEAQQQQNQGNNQSSPSSQTPQSENARNFLLQQQRQHQNSLLNNQAHIDALNLQQQLNATRQNSGQPNGQSSNPSASPLNLGQHLNRMAQFHPQLGGLANNPLNPAMGMFTPDMLSALASFPSQNGLSTSVATSAALQQLHNNLHSATIIN